MIRNLVGEMVEFDANKAEDLLNRFEKWIKDGNLLPYELSDLIFSTWGYGAALEEIKCLKKELSEYKKQELFEFDGLDLPDDYYENETYSSE